MYKSSFNTSAEDSNCRLTRRLIEEGGVSLQRFRWTPAPGNPYSGDQRLLALSLELQLEFYSPGRMEGLLAMLWPGSAQAFFIFGNTILAEPGFSDEIRHELQELNKTSAVDMRLSCLRLAPEAVGNPDGSNKPEFDSIQICSGLVIGSRQVSLGIVYRDIDDRNAELSPRLRWMARQIQQDQTALLPLIRSHRRQPNVARALVNAQSGELIWNNALARVGWPDKSKFIELLIRPEFPLGYESSPGSAVDLTLITFLRSGRGVERGLESARISQHAASVGQPNEPAAEEKAPDTARISAGQAKTADPGPEYFLPDPIKRRLKKVIFNSEKMNRIGSGISDQPASGTKKSGAAQDLG